MSPAALLLSATIVFAPNGVGIPGRTVSPPAPRPAPVVVLAASPVGEAAIGGDADGNVRRYTGDDLRPHSLGRLPGAVQAAVWGKTCAFVADDEGTIAVITTQAVPVAKHGDGVNALALGPRGQLLASAGADGSIRFWTLEGKPVATLAAHEGAVTALALEPGKKPRLWSVGWDGRLKAWAWPRAPRLGRAPGASSQQRRAKPGKGKRRLDRPQLWLPVGKRELSGVAHLKGLLLTSGFDGAVTPWSLERRKPKPIKLALRTNAEWVLSVAAAPDARRFVAVASAETSLLVVDARHPERQPLRLKQAVTPAVAVFLNERDLAVGRFDGVVERVRLPALKEEK